ncbi:c2H2-type domain-containing protein [Nephila pilipes]|uniref:C2H2-type domain-containing protein n=1 Tax=Nephila pilipes TaxID=299642 RepID=A0A8X6PR73_NEPPI|nr:c2H2-type domain-containing protein [Nephila pilipes]
MNQICTINGDGYLSLEEGCVIGDDATSFRLMLQEMATLGEGNPDLDFKFQGPPRFEEFDNEDYFLALQHPLQKEMMKKFREQIICVDSTHGTSCYDF